MRDKQLEQGGFSDHEGYTIDTDKDGRRERDSLTMRDTLSIRTGMGEGRESP